MTELRVISQCKEGKRLVVLVNEYLTYTAMTVYREKKGLCKEGE
jgi:hypothetical protein